MPKLTSWKFSIQPNQSEKSSRSGLKVGASGSIETVQGSDAIRQSIQMLLSTKLGERVMRPEYGCDLDRLVFMPIDETLAGLAIHYVSQAVRRWIPFIEIVNIDASPDPNHPSRLDINLIYRINNHTNIEYFDYSVETQP